MTLSKIHKLFPEAEGLPPQRAAPARVFVMSDIQLMREGIVHGLAQISSLQIVGSTVLAAKPCEIAAVRPDVVLIDFISARALDVSATLHRMMPDTKIVALGVTEADATVLACATAGVSGFVAPEGSAADVAAAVHSAIRGELVCSPRVAGVLLSKLSALSARPAAASDDDMLTPREREIILLINDGLSNKEIARATGIQNATVKNHVHSILGKLRLRRRGEVSALLRRGAVAGPAPVPMPPVPLPLAMVKNRNGTGLGLLV